MEEQIDASPLIEELRQSKKNVAPESDCKSFGCEKNLGGKMS